MAEMAAPDKKRPTAWLERIVRFPVTRMVVFIGVIGVALSILRLATDGLDRGLGAWWPGGVANVVLPILAVHFTYCGIVRLLERRLPAELSLNGAARETGTGALIGTACLSVSVGLIALLGFYRVEATGAWAALVTALGMAAFSGYIEEVIFRGVIFRLVEEGLGTWLALGITVVLFGLMHLGNPNATLYGAAAIGIEAGMLLGAAYVLTRRLWLAIGVHFGWNFMQAGVFGPNVSGVKVGSLLESRLGGPDVLSGGPLGVEGSVFAIAVCLLTSVVVLRRANRENRFVRPFWRRPQPA